jgi:signal transduction histidine kinase
MEDLKRVVLVVDDEEVDRTRVHRWLSDRFALCEAASGRSGLDMVTHLEPDCVILDFCLPDYDGFELLGEFVSRRIPVVMTTGKGDERLAAESVKRGAQDYFPKDSLTREILDAAVEQAIRKRALLEALVDARENLDDVLTTTSASLRPLVAEIESGLEGLAGEAANWDASQRFLFERMRASLQDLDSCVSDLGRYARAGSHLEPNERVDLREVARSVTDRLEGLIRERRAQLDLRDLPIVQGRKGALHQLFLQLIHAALVDPGEGPPTLRARCEFEDTSWTIFLEDDRRPIPEDQRAHLFRPLFLPDSVGHLSGLDMAICARIVRLHGGQISYEARQPSGRVFRFNLPAWTLG